MNTQQAKQNGFIKRAAEHGFSEAEALQVLKLAGGMAPPMQPQMPAQMPRMAPAMPNSPLAPRLGMQNAGSPMRPQLAPQMQQRMAPTHMAPPQQMAQRPAQGLAAMGRGTTNLQASGGLQTGGLGNRTLGTASIQPSAGLQGSGALAGGSSLKNVGSLSSAPTSGK